MIRRWLTKCLDVLYPRDCIFCRQPVEGDGYICEECLTKINFERNACCDICAIEGPTLDGPSFICGICLLTPPNFDRAFVVCRFEKEIRELVILLKYYHGDYLAKTLGQIMLAFYHANMQDLAIAAFVPAPATPKKKRSRGYNQALLLAQVVSHATRIPILSNVLIKKKASSQTTLNANDRRSNAFKSFSLNAKLPDAYMGKNLLIIDDIMTTGATCDACAKLLKEAGANCVYALALARGKMHKA